MSVGSGSPTCVWSASPGTHPLGSEALLPSLPGTSWCVETLRGAGKWSSIQGAAWRMLALTVSVARLGPAR